MDHRKQHWRPNAQGQCQWRILSRTQTLKIDSVKVQFNFDPQDKISLSDVKIIISGGETFGWDSTDIKDTLDDSIIVFHFAEELKEQDLGENVRKCPMQIDVIYTVTGVEHDYSTSSFIYSQEFAKYDLDYTGEGIYVRHS